jgi:hypothetical protein
VWVWGQKKMSQLLGALGLLDFTMLWFLLGTCFEAYKPFIYLIFSFFPACGKPQVTEIADTESVDSGA